VASEQEELKKLLSDLSVEQDRRSPLFSQLLPVKRESTRSHVTKVVVWGYVLLIAAVVAFIFFVPSIHSETKVANLLELIKVAVLPVVTFVIGHYFGSQT